MILCVPNEYCPGSDAQIPIIEISENRKHAYFSFETTYSSFLDFNTIALDFLTTSGMIGGNIQRKSI